MHRSNFIDAMKSVSALSYAKINLTLDVFPRQKGAVCHEIKSVLHKIALADSIEIQESEKFEIKCNAPIDQKKNLITQAYTFLQDFYKKPLPPVSVKLEKNIPIGGGLGGGSSNFASFVELYHELFRLGKISPELITKSGEYGKDIPFFFESKTCCLAEGFGERVTPLGFDFHNKKLFLYQPPFPSDTAQAYKNLTNFSTDFTENFLNQPALTNVGNGFDEMLESKKYQEFFSFHPNFHITGSGSCFWSLEKKDIPQCKIIETRFI